MSELSIRLSFYTGSRDQNSEDIHNTQRGNMALTCHNSINGVTKTYYDEYCNL